LGGNQARPCHSLLALNSLFSQFRGGGEKKKGLFGQSWGKIDVKGNKTQGLIPLGVIPRASIVRLEKGKATLHGRAVTGGGKRERRENERSGKGGG